MPWTYHFDGGYTWCTMLGHESKDYSDPVFVNHIFQGIRYVAGCIQTIDYKKAYAEKFDDPVRY